MLYTVSQFNINLIYLKKLFSLAFYMNLHFKYRKLLLILNTSTPSLMVYDKLGIYLWKPGATISRFLFSPFYCYKRQNRENVKWINFAFPRFCLRFFAFSFSRFHFHLKGGKKTKWLLLASIDIYYTFVLNFIF